MAITVPDLTAAPAVYEFRSILKDTANETTNVTLLIDGAESVSNIQAALRAYEAVTNAAFINPTISARYDITGHRTSPTNAVQPLVAAFGALTFDQVNPVNATKRTTKSIIIPAYIDGIRNTDNSMNSGNSNIAALISFLSDHLGFESADGVTRVGGWTYKATGSGFGTRPSKTDGI